MKAKFAVVILLLIVLAVAFAVVEMQRVNSAIVQARPGDDVKPAAEAVRPCPPVSRN